MENIRSTQRAPLSCINCAKRKVKCSKKLPCTECVRRGLISTCAREKVKIKGHIVSSQSNQGTQTYEELLNENLRLKAALAGQPNSPQHSADEIFVPDDTVETFEQHLFGLLGDSQRSSTVSSELDVDFPSRAFSDFLLAQGALWTSWIHFALHHPTFEAEHALFWQSCSNTDQLAFYNPFWLAVYFSFLSAILVFTDEIDAFQNSIFEMHDTAAQRLKWYDSAVFYLNKADFLRNHDIRSIQAIAILGIVFNNVGDYKLHLVMWSSAVRIGQLLKIHEETELVGKSIIDREVCRRVWWTLVICEWLPIPYRNPCVVEGDFHVDFPAVKDDDEISLDGSSIRHPLDYPRPVHYHIAMIKSAKVYHRFRSAIKTGTWTHTNMIKIVQATDEQLAQIISELPRYLQADGSSSSKPAIDETQFPWIPWQRTNIGLVLLNLRVTVNKTLQNCWSDYGATLFRTRSICLGSSRTIISLVLDGGLPHARLKSWALTANLFSAAVTLVIENQMNADLGIEQDLDPIKKCRSFMRAIEEDNKVAAAALQILDSMQDRHVLY